MRRVVIFEDFFEGQVRLDSKPFWTFKLRKGWDIDMVHESLADLVRGKVVDANHVDGVLGAYEVTIGKKGMYNRQFTTYMPESWDNSHKLADDSLWVERGKGRTEGG